MNNCHFGISGLTTKRNNKSLQLHKAFDVYPYIRENLEEEFMDIVLKRRITHSEWTPEIENQFIKFYKNKRKALKEKLSSGGWVFDKEFGRYAFRVNKKYQPLNYDLHTDEKDKVIGMSSTLSSPEMPGCLYIAKLQVNKPIRGKGYGTHVMKEIVEEAVKKNKPCVHLVSLDENSDKFYRKIGLREINTFEYYGDKNWVSKFLKRK